MTYDSIEGVEHYASRRYRHWDQRWISNREQRMVQQLMKKHGLGGEIMDVPCGYGRFYNTLKEFGNVHGADINHYSVEYYNQRVSSDPGAVEAGADKLPFDDNAFNGSFCFRLLQHMHEPEERIAILKELKRISKDWIIASLYLSSPVHLLHRAIIKMPSKITQLTPNQLNQEVAAAGLKMHTMKSVVPGLHAHRICLFFT